MKRKENYLLHSVAGQNVIVPVGDACKDFNGMLTVNETGKFIWEQLAEETDIEKLVQALLAEYDVSADTAEQDVQKFLDGLRKAHALNE